MTASRIERDTLGEIEVPATAYWGAQTERARRNFPLGGGGIPRPLIHALGELKAAAARANRDLGHLDARLAAAIEQAAREVAEGKLDDQFPVDVFQTGSGTSSHMNANEVIANRASEILGQPLGSKHVDPNDHVNLGQSSNDVFPTAVHLALASAEEKRLLPALEALASRLHALADATFESMKTGRTHLMDALPIRFGQVFRGHAGQVERGAGRIREALGSVLEVPLGGTAVGTGVNADPRLAAGICEHVSQQTGIALRETGNHFQAQSSLDALVHASAALRTFATGLFKVANDVRWMASSAVGELEIPAVQPGSSIMPAKVNPVICESVLMVCAQVIANDAAVVFGNTQGNFELNTMMPLIAHNVLGSAMLLGNACAMFTESCLSGLTVRRGAEDALQRNPMLATALSGAVGYEAAAKIAKEAERSGRTVREVARELTDIRPEDLDRLLDVARLCGERGRSR